MHRRPPVSSQRDLALRSSSAANNRLRRTFALQDEHKMTDTKIMERNNAGETHH